MADSLRKDRSDLTGFVPDNWNRWGWGTRDRHEQGRRLLDEETDMFLFFQQRQLTYANHFRCALRPHHDFHLWQAVRQLFIRFSLAGSPLAVPLRMDCGEF